MYTGQVDVIPWKHTSENGKGCKTATQPHACQLRQTAGGAVPLAEAGIESCLAASEEPCLSISTFSKAQLSKKQLQQHTT